MGRELAAVALAIISTKDPEYFATSPGGYFHGMVAKARAGELHLERTVWALRAQIPISLAPRLDCHGRERVADWRRHGFSSVPWRDLCQVKER